MTLFEQAITDMLKSDYQGRFGIPLMVEAGEKTALERMVSEGTSKGIIRAAWQYYLDDERMHQVGTIGVAQFLKHLNRYLFQARRKVEKPGVQGRRRDEYVCLAMPPGGGDEHGPFIDPETGWYIEPPDKCPRCGAELIPKALWWERQLAGRVTVPAGGTVRDVVTEAAAGMAVAVAEPEPPPVWDEEEDFL